MSMIYYYLCDQPITRRTQLGWRNADERAPNATSTTRTADFPMIDLAAEFMPAGIGAFSFA
jgi:hypothetical protein